MLGVARVAGIMGAKRTSDLIPLCHILNLTKLTIDFVIKEESCEIEAVLPGQDHGADRGGDGGPDRGFPWPFSTIYDMCQGGGIRPWR